LVTFILPESYASTARIKLAQGAPAANLRATNQERPLPNTRGENPFLTELETIRSEAVLGKVVERLNLNTVWARRYLGGDGRLKTAESLGMLKARLDLRLLPNTSIIQIRVFSEAPDEAATIANTIVEAYTEFA